MGHSTKTNRMVTSPSETAATIKVLDSAFAMLSVLGQHSGPVGVRELSRQTGINKTTAHRILASLTLANLVSFDENSRKYSVGPGILQYAAAFVVSSDLIACAGPLMTRLWKETGETVLLSVKDKEFRVGIHQLESPEPLRFVGRIGHNYPLNLGATGRALLLQLPDDKVEFFIRAGPVAGLTSESITDPDRIIELIAEARKRGWALSHGEIAIGGVAISVPLHTETPEPAALSLYLPEARAPVDEIERLVGLTTTATSIRQAYELSAAGVE